MAARANLIGKISKAVKATARAKNSEWWYTPHMATASQAIADRIPLVDLLLEVRDARIPFSSSCDQLREVNSSKHIIVLNKMDLAKRSHTEDWIRYFEEQQCTSFAVNSHNKESIKEFLTFLQAQVRVLKKIDTITVMLVGIPNVGKSALANTLHHVGRISAIEKGKLKHSVVSPQPGETKSISSLKIASHPSIYVLDTPSILPPELIDDLACSKLALTGAIKDSAAGVTELSQYCLSILSSNDEYKKWGKLSNAKFGGISTPQNSSPLKIPQGQHPKDHTQDFIVNKVRHILFETFSSFTGDIENEESLVQLIEDAFRVLVKVFHLPPEIESVNYCRVASKLLNLYRTGRLGRYTLDFVPTSQ